ncbi:MAG: tRNA (uridine(54)-C5)-methyltransferase TrmA [Cellvibrionaceae bacterium]|nr:tRNA (uridine(54)-C5)-methyltransferase TrmA [Cellvibrionaceae bacterium]
MNFSNDDYQQQLNAKHNQTLAEFAEFGVAEVEVFPSPQQQYRMRAEFKAWHSAEGLSYAMFEPGSRKAYDVETFVSGSAAIQTLMPRLRDCLNANQVLRNKLFQIEFLTSTSGESLVTLIYHKPLNDSWQAEAELAAQQLQTHIIGRSRGQKRVLSQDYIYECFNVAGRDFRYQQLEGSFTQPNGYVCRDMLEWAAQNSRDFGGDLLELYCGNGNFTLPLSRNFNKVLATEVAKPSIHSALHNCELNQIDNITFVRMSAEDICGALNQVRTYERLKNIALQDYNFSTVFVDPPRSGMDETTTEFVSRFDNIIYISCNPLTLKDNLQIPHKTHRVERMALFDQFPYTEHRECGVVLRRR